MLYEYALHSWAIKNSSLKSDINDFLWLDRNIHFTLGIPKRPAGRRTNVVFPGPSLSVLGLIWFCHTQIAEIGKHCSSHEGKRTSVCDKIPHLTNLCNCTQSTNPGNVNSNLHLIFRRTNMRKTYSQLPQLGSRWSNPKKTLKFNKNFSFSS